MDGVVCGHIHQPEIVSKDGILYCNDGDWIENCTALLEDHQGNLELIHCTERKQAIKSLVASNDGEIDDSLSIGNIINYNQT